MPHHTPLIETIVAGIGLAFLLGALANRLRLSPLVGYLIAGVLVGPHTPGFVADQTLAPELAEIGVILLMFGVGLHFSIKDLMSVKAIAIPGALVQIAFATALGMALAWAMGWPAGAGLVFGLALSVASTVVLLRAMEERRMIETGRGRIAVGWLIVEDLAMVLALVLLPAVAGLLDDRGAGATSAGSQAILLALGITLAKVAGFVAVMLVVGRRLVPWILHHIAHTGSRELFRLSVLAIALGVAYGAAVLFGVSFALGAFFAGMVMSESDLSQQAAAEAMPLRDAFAVLFFVSVGMLFDPMIVLQNPLPMLAVLLIILVGKSAAALLIVLAFRHPMGTALTIAASLAQIGEFSFILAGLGVSLKLLPKEGQDLILAGAILSILANPLIFIAADRLGPRLERRAEPAPAEPAAPPPPEDDLPTTSLTDHAVIVGHGRVGSVISEAARQEGWPILVIEDRRDVVEGLRERGIDVIRGNAATPRVLAAANIGAARCLFVAIPNAFEAGQIVQQARAARADLDIFARAHSDAEVEHLHDCGATATVMGEREIALGMMARARDSKDKKLAAPSAAPASAADDATAA
ncbi:YbaL family putative K(+) efflux transporter [Vineibacter terrae]|uniref:YbaL family putative K(+) efflux transporter n=1 Tax=Vineibacter terrae TaxID=2586908 RepID=UPI002E321999|nr:YbaL family putative K(+) efflux transporter [Vineibacter terrae]HEX2890684.1 YbaL family putative K(+) efflux transporter [Vineibacter terrae]